jgi:tRNA(Arg) A34 adenosine deaminase TadA
MIKVLKFLSLVYEEVEIAIQEGNPPFAAIITNSENNILAVAHNQANIALRDIIKGEELSIADNIIEDF